MHCASPRYASYGCGSQSALDMSAASSWTDVAAAAAGGEVLAAGRGSASAPNSPSRRGILDAVAHAVATPTNGHGTALAGANRKRGCKRMNSTLVRVRTSA